MDDHDKQLYDAMDQVCMDYLLHPTGESYIEYTLPDNGHTYESNEISNIKWIFMKDNPQYFFFDHYGFESYDTFDVMQKYTDISAFNSEKAYIRQVIDEYIAEVPDDALPEQIESNLARQVCRKVTYDYDNPASDLQNLDSACEGSTVCSGYCMLFEALMNRAGVQCSYLSIDCEGMDRHAVNVVNLHGFYYYIDMVNYDSPAKYSYYNYCDLQDYEPDFHYRDYARDVRYDNVVDRQYWDGPVFYTPRYVEIEGNTYFIVHETEDGSEFLAEVVVYNGSSVRSSIEYDGFIYRVLNREGYPVYDPAPTTAPSPSPTEGSSSNDTDSIPASGYSAADFVERLYSVALGRSSDASGLNSWVEAISVRGETGGDVARGFLYSDEFINKNVSSEEFVRVLYRTFFNREPDASGLQGWVNALDEGQSKQDVIEGFINSNEWANLCILYGIRSGGTGTATIEVEPNQETIDFATRLYTTCLGRNADEAGMMAWARQLANQRDTGTGVARGFFFSNEFTGQNVDNSEYVTRLYRTFMGREPDQAGFDAWVGALNEGTSREEVFDGFAQSVEFARICASYGIIR
ncbi:MAG: DUF4214 domain-containing protein [Clostridiales bacterium]|nr:DUF4214 domain-containing protein [Clostridiales bacterium]